MWTSIGCTLVFQDKLYHIQDNMFVIDLYTWETMDMGSVPSFARRPGRCAVATVDDTPGAVVNYITYKYNSLQIFLSGLMLRNGYWFNLIDSTWEAKRFPPNPPNTIADPDALYTFRGAPTMFGGAVCDSELTCEYREVLQYDSEEDLWVSLGNMMESRGFHEVNCYKYIKVLASIITFVKC